MLEEISARFNEIFQLRNEISQASKEREFDFTARIFGNTGEEKTTYTLNIAGYTEWADSADLDKKIITKEIAWKF